MKALFFLVLIFSLHLGGIAQNGLPENTRHTKDILQRIEWIEKENTSLKSLLRSRDSLRYSEVRNDILKAYAMLPLLQSDFHATADKIAVTSLFTKLIQANNPTSDILGFRFSDVIYTTCEKHFLNKIRNEKEKKRFGQIIQKIIQNPIFSSLLNSTPVTSIIGSIISVIASFSSPSLEISKNGNRVDNVEISQHDVFNQEDIESFKQDLQVYIDFYEALSQASGQYIAGIASLDLRKEELQQRISNTKTALNVSLASTCGPPDTSLIRLLPDPRLVTTDFLKYLYEPWVQQAYKEALKISGLQGAVSDYKKDYQKLLMRYLERFLEILQMTRGFPGEVAENDRLDALKKDIREYMHEYLE